MLVRFQSEELADETSWRPKWTPSGPVALVEPNNPGDINDVATDPGDAGFEFDAELELGAGDEVVLAEAVAGAVAGQFIVSIVGRSQTRTLHRVGECYRRPGEHYSQFEVLGDEPPDASKYHRACQSCFGKAGAVAGNSLEDDSSGEVDSSDSMESEVEASS